MKQQRSISVRGESSSLTFLVACLAIVLCLPTPIWSAETTLVTLNASGMNVTQALKLLSDEGDIDLAIDGRVNGSVTLFLEQVTVSQALKTICNAADLAYVKEDGVYQVMPGAAFRERFGVDFSGAKQTRVFVLRHADPAPLQAALEKLKSPNGSVVVDARSGAVVVTDAAPIIERIETLIAAWDVPNVEDNFALEYVSAEEVVQQLKDSGATGVSLRIVPSTNTINLSGSSDRVRTVKERIRLLDIPPQVQRRVLRLSYADHAAIVNAISPELTPGAGRIQPDAGGRLLVVLDFPGKLDAIEQLVAQLDTPRPEVLIEARIFQVTLTDDLKFGVDWEAVNRKLDNLTVAGSFPPGITDDSNLEVSAGVIETDDYNAIVQALSTVGKTNLLSSPRILAVDGKDAKILVGSTTPFTTVDTREEGGTIRTFEKVTYVETGVKLEVTPRVHDTSWVTLDVRPEVSSVVAFSEDRIPVVETKTTETSVRVLTGRTVIIAGLVEDQEIETRKGIPFLHQIPLLGRLFGSTERRVEKRELVVLLTPSIVAGEDDYDLIEKER